MRITSRFITPFLLGPLFLAACSAQNPFGPAGGVSAGPTPAPTVVPLPTAVLISRATVAVDGALALALPATQLGFETSGRVIEVNAVPGTKVKKGAILARLDDIALGDALVQAREQLALVRRARRRRQRPPRCASPPWIRPRPA
jgi:multidrug efflux pump subunit AcrA (membrane-fusion protein)